MNKNKKEAVSYKTVFAKEAGDVIYEKSSALLKKQRQDVRYRFYKI